ncbi:MAG: aspartyl/asparaginyl beta-hydroxylase domain-containing protein [Candidatus Margulisbacteria bacterium]|nr:aspartyl/asparaginyl beta-hydroxylase domain-containing protein [Candidatus Margulisiibacteriota bacterium]
MFNKNKDFPWIHIFEDHWIVVRDELMALHPDTFKPWPETAFFNKGWTTFGLYAWTVKLDINCAKCPKTTALIEQVPGLISCGFSSMQPGTHILPHSANPQGILRLHVPLKVPGKAVFRVANETKEWVEGKCFVFDDSQEHEAINYSDGVRVVMLVDFEGGDLVINSPPPPKWFQKLLR